MGHNSLPIILPQLLYLDPPGLELRGTVKNSPSFKEDHLSLSAQVLKCGAPKAGWGAPFTILEQ